MLKNVFLFFIFGVFLCTSAIEIIDLGGDDWHFSNYEGNIEGQATVPGNIYQDLANNGLINEKDEYADVNNTWVAEYSWIYTKKFNVSTKNVKLVMKSLDTFGYIQINDHDHFVFFDNMFVKKEVYLKDLVELNKENKLKILFFSPIAVVNERAKKFKENNGFDLPPSKLPDSYHGVNHANFMRKMQASFSWDWGPQMVISGIVDEIYLVADSLFDIDCAIIDTIRVDSKDKQDSKDWLIKTKVHLKLNQNVKLVGRYRFFLNDKEIKSKDSTHHVQGETGYMVINEFELGPFSSDEILPWYPNNFDYMQENRQDLKPNLYNFTVWVENRNGSKLINKRSFNIGFREIKLIEEPLIDGKSFYFQINGIPFFARGINYIPTTLNLGNLTEEKAKFTYLLRQVKDSNMNMIRVWGGGDYAKDEFYDLADELGIMIWQDFMFACALYEADHKHLESAKEEVTYQVRRLQHHPSIAIFSGNNEIEGAISSNWWNEVKDPNVNGRVRVDYIELFEKTIRYTVTNLTSSIPYVASSPTNNDESIFEKTGNPRKGDIHFYDYGKDSLNESKYPKARFVSEFGFQSYPSISTISKVMGKEHLSWPIEEALEHRQHAPGQNGLLKNQVTYNLNFKSENAIGQDALEEFIYLTQVIQALSVKSEAEGYLSDRDENLWQGNNSLRLNVNNINMGSVREKSDVDRTN